MTEAFGFRLLASGKRLLSDLGRRTSDLELHSRLEREIGGEPKSKCDSGKAKGQTRNVKIEV